MLRREDVPRFKWTREQEEFLRRNADKLDGELIGPLSALGPPRTPAAITDKRRLMKLPQNRSNRSSREAIMEMNARQAQDRADWPDVRGDQVARDRAFQRKLWAAQLEALRARAFAAEA